MPTLNRYAESANKKGYYIRANVGTGSPVTLQVSDLVERIFWLLDYEPPATIPTKLVWNMYDVGLLYTLNSLSSATNGIDNDSTSLLEKRDLDSSLSQEREEEIITRLKEYDGPDTEEVEKLIERFERSGGSSPTTTSSEQGDLTLLQKWAENPEKLSDLADTFDGYEKFASASVQTFAKHPYLSAPPIWFQDDGAIKYRVEKSDKKRDVFIADSRFRPDFDFKVTIDHGDDRYEVANVSRTCSIISYHNEANRLGSRIRMSGMLDWVVPNEKTLVDIPFSSDLYGEGRITEYKGEKLEPIQKPVDGNPANFVVGVVDRISGSDNPVVEERKGHFILDQGKLGEKYLVEMMSSNRGRVLSRFHE